VSTRDAPIIGQYTLTHDLAHPG